MGRKLTAVRVHKRSGTRRKYKTVAVRNYRRRPSKVLRKDFRKSTRERPFGIQQIIEDNLRKFPLGKLFVVHED